jgi:polysaccharide biosynthesis transport protein
MEEKEIDLRDYINVVWKRRKMILVIFLAAVIITAIVSLFMPKVYESSLTIMVNRPKYQLSLEPKIQTMVSPEVSVETYHDLINDRKLIEQVIQKLIIIDPAYASLKPDDLQNTIKMTAIPKTNLIEMKIQAGSRKKAIDIIDTWVKLFVESNENLNLQETKEAQTFILEQLKVTGENLDKREEELSKFNEKNKIELLTEQIQEKTSQIAQYEKDKVELGLSISIKEAELKQIEEELKKQDEKTVLSKSVTDDKEIEDAVKQKSNPTPSELKNLRFSSEAINPTYAQLIRMRSDADISLSSWKENLSYLKNNSEKLVEDLMVLKKELAGQQLTHDRLSRQISAINQTYDILSQKAEETRIAAATKPGLIKIVKDVYSSENAIGPHKRRNIVIAGIVGLMFGIFLAFLAGYFGHKEN